MKKLLLLCSVVFMYACSHDNAETTNPNLSTESFPTAARPATQIENATDQMFYDYYNSDIFKEVNLLIVEFNEDLNYLAHVDTEEQLFSWIGSNLSQTNFTSVQQARNRWDNIVTKKSIEVAQFQNVYNFIWTAPIGDAKFYIDKWYPNGQNSTTSDICDTRFDNCTQTAVVDYINRSLYGFSASSTNVVALSHAMLDADMTVCRKSYRRCMGYE